jgi:hypothetical protein
MKYEYTDQITRDFPTLGLRNVKNGDTFESDVEINSPFVKKVLDTPASVAPVEDKVEEEIRIEEDKITELKSEETKGVV